MDGVNSNFDDGGLLNDFELSPPLPPRTDPPDPFAPGFNDFRLSVDDPFSDFRWVDDWLLGPSSLPARTDGIEAVPMHADGMEVEKPDGSVPNEEESGFPAERRGEIVGWSSLPDGRDLQMFRGETSEVSQEIGIGGQCPGGYEAKITGNEINQEILESNGIENAFRLDGADVRMPGLDFEIADDLFGAFSSSLGEQIAKFFSSEAGNSISMDAAVGEEGDGCQEMAKLEASAVSVPNAVVKLESNGNEKSDVESGEKASEKGEGSSESNGGRDSASWSGKEKEERYDNVKMEDDDELEEGEIRESDGAEVVFRYDEEERATEGPSTSKNKHKILPPVPPVNVVLESHHQTMPVGIIVSIMGTKVIVEGVERHNMLREGSILWITETRSLLGLIDEIFGPVKKPYYIVRYNSEKEVPAVIYEGSSVSIVEEFATCIPNDVNLCKKRYNAFSENDKQVPDEIEFFDVKETERKNMLRMAKRENNNWEQRYWQSVGQNNTQVIERVQKNAQPSAPQPAGVGPARPTGVNMQFVPGQFQNLHLPPPAGVGPSRPTGVNMQFVPGQFQNLHLPLPAGVGPAGPTGVNLQFVPGQFQNVPLPPPAGVGTAGRSGVDLQFALGQVQNFPLPVQFGSCSSSSHTIGQIGTNGLPNSHMAQTVGYLGGPPQHFWLQTNAVRPNGMPSQQQNIPSGYAMNAQPHQQQPNSHHPHQRYPVFLGENPYHSQFNPTQMQLPIVAPHHGIPAGSTHGTMCLGCGMRFQNQGHQEHPFGGTVEQGASSNGQRFESIVQGGISVPQQYNHGHPFGGTGERGGSSNGKRLESIVQGGISVPQQYNHGMASNHTRTWPHNFGGLNGQGDSKTGQVLSSTAQGMFSVSQQSNNGMASGQGRGQPHCFGGMGGQGDSSIGQLPPSAVQGGSSASSNRGKRWPPRGHGHSKRGRQQSG